MQEKTRICNWGAFNFPSTCFCFLNYILSQQQITSSDVRLRILQRMDYMFVLKCMSDNNQYIPLKNEYILHPRLNIYCIRD